MAGGRSASSGFRWELLERAGEGTTAVVWKARDRETGALAALKVARDTAPILEEAALVARIACRWSPALLDAGVVPAGQTGLPAGARYLALAWTEGKPIAPKERGRAPSDKIAAAVAHGVGRALAELHLAGVRHGDVKPSNIVLASKPPRRDTAITRLEAVISHARRVKDMRNERFGAGRAVGHRRPATAAGRRRCPAM